MKKLSLRIINLLLVFFLSHLFVQAIFSNAASGQPYENGIKYDYAQQGNSQCGPASFYMIFKYYGDHLKDDVYYDSEDNDWLTGSTRDIRIDTDYLSPSSPFAYLFDIQNNSQILDRSNFRDKIEGLMYNNEVYYDGTFKLSKTTSPSTKRTRFNQIKTFLNNNQPVIIHLDRYSIYWGHFIVIVGFDEDTDEVIYMDPNLDKYINDGDPLVYVNGRQKPLYPLKRINYDDFINDKWYENDDNKPWWGWYKFDAWWDGIWYGFYPACPDCYAEEYTELSYPGGYYILIDKQDEVNYILSTGWQLVGTNDYCTETVPSSTPLSPETWTIDDPSNRYQMHTNHPAAALKYVRDKGWTLSSYKVSEYEKIPAGCD